jgi:hypothetical protein
MFPELEPFADAWDVAAAKLAKGPLVTPEWGRSVVRRQPDCAWILIDSLKKTQAHYEFIARGRDETVRGLRCSGVIGIELHIEVRDDFFKFVNGLRERLISRFPRISGERWQYGHRLAFLLPSSMPDAGVEWMQQLILETRTDVLNEPRIKG